MMKNSSSCFLLFLLCATAAAQTPSLPTALDKGDTTLTSLVAASIRSGNAVIAVQVNDTLGGGLNPHKGLFSIGTADNKPLLYLFPQERYTSHFNVRIDGTVYSNDPTRTGAQLLPLLLDPVIQPDSTIFCAYRLAGVTIEQRLKPQQYTTTTGAIFIQYEIINNDAVSHQVGLLLELDTFIVTRDDAPVSTSFGYSRREQQFTAPFIPDYFQAFERNDLVSPGLVAQGTLVGRSAVRPDVVIVGNWSNLSRVQWDYTVPNQFYDDSAVILRWNETRLAPGERRIFATYYGLGDVTTTSGQLALNLTAPNRLEAIAGLLTPNPFEINLVVFNTGLATANSVQAALKLPPGLTLVSGDLETKPVSPSDLSSQQIGTVSWKVLALCPMVDDTLEFSVNVAAANALANSIKRTIILPSCAASLPGFTLTASPPSRTIVAGQAANYTVSMQPSGGFVDNVRLSLFPTIPGVPPPTFVPPNINPATTSSTLTLQTTTSLLPGNYNFVVLGEGGGLARSDTVTLVVQAVDATPPFTTNHNPARNASNVPLNTEVVVEVHDLQSGVDRNSLSMMINGTTAVPSITDSLQAFILRYTPTPAFRDNQSVEVRVNARDLASNQMPEDRYSFTTVRDSLPPFTLDHFPARNASNIPIDTKIEVRIRDLLTGVNQASIVMRINGQIVSPRISGGQYDHPLSFQPSVNFRLNDTVSVQITAADLASTPNTTTDNYSFVTVRDVNPPFTTNHNPARRATNVPPNMLVSVEVRDDLAGVDSSSIVMRVNGRTVNPAITGDRRNYTLSYPLSGGIATNDTVWVSIDASDLAVPRNKMAPDDYFFVLATLKDTRPPFATGHRPAKDAVNVPLDTDIQIEVRDDLAGVDRPSIVMKVNGQPVQPVVTPIAQGYHLRHQPLQNFCYNETVQVVIGARDLANPANVMSPDTLRFVTVRDEEPPFVTDQQPARGSQDAPANTNITLHVRDLVAGVDQSAIVLTVNGAPVVPTISGNPQDRTVEYNPPQDFAPGEIVQVSVVAADFSCPPNVMPPAAYSFSIQPVLPDLAVMDLRSVGILAVGVEVEVIGEITNSGGMEAGRAFSVQLRVDNEVRKDTTLSKLARSEQATLRMPLRFQTTGTHEVELVADAGDQIREVTEANNRQKLVLQIAQALVNRLVVRPNPFTPNNDGFNDQIEFDYSGLGLRNPSLQIFDANGISVWNSRSGARGSFKWDGRDDHGREVAPGVYLYSLRDQGNNVTSGYVVVAR